MLLQRVNPGGTRWAATGPPSLSNSRRELGIFFGEGGQDLQRAAHGMITVFLDGAHGFPSPRCLALCPLCGHSDPEQRQSINETACPFSGLFWRFHGWHRFSRYPVSPTASPSASPFPCGGKLIEAAQEAGLNLLTDCSNGPVRHRTAQLVSGSVDLDDYDSAVLTDADRACEPCCPASAAPAARARSNCPTTPAKR